MGFGVMVGCQDALNWLKSLHVSPKDANMKERVLNRMKYEFSKNEPVEPKFSPGKFGHKYDSYTCGNCGYLLKTGYRYCPNCSYRITDNYLGRRKTAAEHLK